MNVFTPCKLRKFGIPYLNGWQKSLIVTLVASTSVTMSEDFEVDLPSEKTESLARYSETISRIEKSGSEITVISYRKSLVSNADFLVEPLELRTVLLSQMSSKFPNLMNACDSLLPPLTLPQFQSYVPSTETVGKIFTGPSTLPAERHSLFSLCQCMLCSSVGNLTTLGLRSLQ
jgi:hypothetical protein